MPNEGWYDFTSIDNPSDSHCRGDVGHSRIHITNNTAGSGKVIDEFRLYWSDGGLMFDLTTERLHVSNGVKLM